MSDLTFVQGDGAPAVQGTLTQPDGDPFDLTDATVRFQMRPLLDRRFSVDAEATIVDEAAGTVRYDWEEGDLAAAGEYAARWQITLQGGAVEHTNPANTITISPQ